MIGSNVESTSFWKVLIVCTTSFAITSSASELTIIVFARVITGTSCCCRSFFPWPAAPSRSCCELSIAFSLHVNGLPAEYATQVFQGAIVVALLFDHNVDVFPAQFAFHADISFISLEFTLQHAECGITAVLFHSVGPP